MLEYIEKILDPYMARQREQLGLSPDAPGLCIFDVFAAHRCDEFLQSLREHNIRYVMVPAGCTGSLQPLDVATNEPFKHHLKELFSSWYADKVRTLLDSGLAVENIKVDLRTSVIKPIHFGWLVKNMEWLSSQDQMLRRGWKDIAILDKLQIN